MIKTQKELKYVSCGLSRFSSRQERGGGSSRNTQPGLDSEICNKLPWGKSTYVEQSIMEVLSSYCVRFTYFVDVRGEGQIDM